MKKANWLPVFRFLGVAIMLLTFLIVPDYYPWYSEVILFNIGLILLLVTKWSKLGKELGFNE